jgi:hypothetical protein
VKKLLIEGGLSYENNDSIVDGTVLNKKAIAVFY